MLSREDLINKFNSLNNENVVQYLYNNQLKKDELLEIFDFDLFKKHTNMIIKNYGLNVYYELELNMIKKMIKNNVTIDYFKQRFNYNFFERYKDILINSFGNDQVNECLQKYNI